MSKFQEAHSLVLWVVYPQRHHSQKEWLKHLFKRMFCRLQAAKHPLSQVGEDNLTYRQAKVNRPIVNSFKNYF
jgi:hypothetical protein